MNCSTCNIDGGCDSFATCAVCGTIECNGCGSSCTSIFFCEFCERWLCPNCVPNVPCKGSECDASNCMDCAVTNRCGVIKCTHCGEGFCSECKSMERCFQLGGDICPECHIFIHGDFQCYWQAVPPQLKQLVAKFATEISMDRIVDFWRECIQLLWSDNEFDVHIYRKSRQAGGSSFILAANCLRKG